MNCYHMYLCIALFFIVCFSMAAGAQTVIEWYDRGHDCILDGDFDGAVKYFTKAIEADPTYVYSYDSRGLAYTNLKQYDLAIADFKKAIEIDPDFPFPYNNLASAYYYKGDFENALESLTAAIERDPIGSSFNARADVYRELGRYDEALADIEHVQALYPGYPQWIYTRGLIYRDMGDVEKARADLEYACTEGMPKACEALEDMK